MNFSMNTPLLLILVNFCLVAISIWFLIKSKIKAKDSSKGLPPGPSKLPIIGNLHQLGTLPHRSLQSLSKKYGPLMFLQLGSVPTVVVSSAEIAEDIFKNHDLVFSKRAPSYAVKKLSFNYSDITFSECGKYWREVKKAVTLELLGARKIQTFQAVRKEEIELMLDAVAHSSEPVDVGELMNSLACDVICRVAFGEKYDGGKTSSFNDMVKETESLLGVFCLADYFPSMGWINKFNGLDARLEKNYKEQDMLYSQVIEKHRRESTAEHEDLVYVLLQMQKNTSKDLSITNEQIKGVTWDMFTAGSDTSSVTLEWTMAELIKNPVALKKAVDEVREVARGKTYVDESVLPNLPYLKSAIKEALRLHPPLPLMVPRETYENCTIKGYKIPAKTRVYINLLSISTDPKYWKDPNEYQPERFLDSPIDYNGLNFEYMPFGSGRRICPGINFTTLLIELVLANFLFHFNWKIPGGVSSKDLNMEEAFGLTVHRKIPLRLVAIRAPA